MSRSALVADAGLAKAVFLMGRTWACPALALVILVGACGPSSAPAGNPAPSVSSVLTDERAWYPAPGALALVRLGGQEWTGQSGAADLAGTTITASTRFRIASITKPLVAILVLQAVTRGEVTLDSSVDELLPRILQPGPAVTVRMLLDHTSGIFDETNDATDIAGDINRISDPAVRAEGQALLPRYLGGQGVIAPDSLLVAMAETHDRYFVPGGYQLAAIVLERVTGKKLADLLQTWIVAPLGLHHTSLTPPDLASPELRGYESAPGKPPADITDNLAAFGNGGSGGVISTAGELLTIFQALMSGRLLPPPLVAEMEKTTAQSGLTYGLGLAIYRVPCGIYYGHGGSVNGTESQALVSADGRSGAVVALNLRSQSDPDLPALAGKLICSRAGT